MKLIILLVLLQVVAVEPRKKLNESRHLQPKVEVIVRPVSAVLAVWVVEVVVLAVAVLVVAEVVVAVGQVEQVGDPVDLRDQQQLRYPNHHSNHFRLIPLISTLQVCLQLTLCIPPTHHIHHICHTHLACLPFSLPILPTLSTLTQQVPSPPTATPMTPLQHTPPSCSPRATRTRLHLHALWSR